MGTNYLIHHGIKGMRWGVRRYQNPDGTLTEEGRRRLYKNTEKFLKSNSSLTKQYREKYYNKKDQYISKCMPQKEDFNKRCSDILKEHKDAFGPDDNVTLKDVKRQFEGYTRSWISSFLSQPMKPAKEPQYGEESLVLDHNKRSETIKRVNKIKQEWQNERKRIIDDYVNTIGKESIHKTNKKSIYSHDVELRTKQILLDIDMDFKDVIGDISGNYDYAFSKNNAFSKKGKIRTSIMNTEYFKYVEAHPDYE